MYDPDSLHRYGTPMPPLEEDEVPSKKPVHPQDQIATDENGRRRFHGAFTGGFSAGYWNTVGSQEGWTPQSFKSSRSERASQRIEQKPTDFMDDEDKGEFGIAPTILQTSEDYTGGGGADGRKRKLGADPIPVLREILEPRKDKVGVRIMKSWGWRPGQGVGPRVTRKQKKEARKMNERQRYLLQHYGDDGAEAAKKMPGPPADSDSDASDDSDDDAITFAPDDFEPLYHMLDPDKPFGLGYKPLEAPSSSQGAAGLLGSERFDLEVLDKNNKKISIRGQAFGVGAFEDEDEDIYAADDMKRYDFSLDDGPRRRPKPKQFVQEAHVLGGFVESSAPFVPFYSVVPIPPGWKARNWNERRSRFTPLDPHKARELGSRLEKVDLNPEKRAAMLGEPPAAEVPTQTEPVAPPTAEKTKEERTRLLLDMISSKGNNFVRGGLITADGEEKKAVPPPAKEKPLVPAAVSFDAGSGSFKPFVADEAKQQRYDQFLAAHLHDEAQIRTFLNEIQPLQMSKWDREMELKEFVQARKIYRPLGGSMSDRFVSESSIETDKKPKEDPPKDSGGGEQPKKIVMQRSVSMWKPHSLLCKRYNIPEPFGGAMAAESSRSKKKEKLSIFNYLEGSVNTKASFQTPVIIPKHIEKPLPMASNFTGAPEVAGPPTQSETPLEAAAKDTPTDTSKPPPPLPPPTSSSSAPPAEPVKERKDRFAFVPKTDLEKRVVESLNKPPAEKLELYRAIFEDDSDDQEANDEKEEKEGDAAAEDSDAKEATEGPSTSRAVAEPVALAVHKTAAAANLLRNTSPPRGIFAALFTKPEEPQTEPAPKITFKSKNERGRPDKDAGEDEGGKVAATPVATVTGPPPVEDEAAFYGPKLPDRVPAAPAAAAGTTLDEKEIDQRLLEIFRSSKSSAKDLLSGVKKLRGASGSGSSDSGSSSSSDDDDGEESDSSKTKKSKKKSKKAKKSSSSKKKKKKKAGHKHSSHGHTHVKEKKHSKKKDKKSHKEKKSSKA